MAEQNNIIAKVPPHSLEAEESLLGSLLIDKDAIIKVADLIMPQDFYKDANKIIYDIIKELYSRQEPIDIIAIANRLEEKKQLAAIGGRSYLAQLSNAVATSGNVTNYANIIQRKATLRRLQTAAAEISQLSFDEEKEIDEILD
jgi:replicative DNA helicase